MSERLPGDHLADQHGPVFELQLPVERAQDQGFYNLFLEMMVFVLILHRKHTA